MHRSVVPVAAGASFAGVLPAVPNDHATGRVVVARATSARDRRHATALRWLPLTFAAAALVVYLLWYWNPVYRFDEYLVAVARTGLSWGALFRVITDSDPAPGPLYVLMKPWTSISSDPWWTRLPSVIAMAIAVGGVVAFTKATIGTRTAVFAGLLMIVLPVTSRWAQDNRMYAPVTACTVVAVMFWWRSITTDSRRWSVGYGVAVVAMGLLHLYTLTLIPALILAAHWMPGARRSRLLRTIGPPAIALIVLLPHIYLNVSHPTGSPANPAVSLLSVAAMGNVGALCGGAGQCPAVPFAVGITVVTALLAVGGAAWAWQFPGRRAVVALGVCWVLVPLILFVGVRAVTDMPTLVTRYAVFTVPGVCIVAALGLDALYSHWRPGAIIALAIVVALAVPQQLAVRSAGSHSADAYRLGLLLGQPELARLQIMTATPYLKLTVDLATYPNKVIAPPTAAPQPVAVVVTRSWTLRAASRIPYARLGSPWMPVVTCTMPDPRGRDVLLEVVAVPGTSIPAGDPDALATRLNAAVPGSPCVALP